MLGTLELQQVQRLQIDEDLVLAHHEVATLEGDFLQELARRAARMSLAGVASGSEAGTALADLRARFREVAPVEFTADISSATRINKVLVEEMVVRELAGKPERYEYAITLRQFDPPPSDETEPPPLIETPPPPPVDSGTLIVEVKVEGQPEFDFTLVALSAEDVVRDAGA